MKYPVNTVLHTKDGRKIGNAIVIGNNEKFNNIKTDYGTKTKLTDAEIEELFYVGFSDLTPEETALMLETRGAHKNHTYNQLTEIRNELFNSLPSGEVAAWDLIQSIKNHLQRLDSYIDNLPDKLKLNVVLPGAYTIHEQLGISKERCIELEIFMDGMVKNIIDNPGSVIIVSENMEKIAAFCNNLEEYTICCISHCDFLIRKCNLRVQTQ